jgi:hypothetical protein
VIVEVFRIQFKLSLNPPRIAICITGSICVLNTAPPPGMCLIFGYKPFAL